jgi:HlyD family secretion protein
VDQKIDQEIMVQNADASFVSARENLAVTKNQAESDVDKARLAYNFAKQDLDKYLNGEYPNELRKADAKITLAREEYTRAQDTLDWSKRLFNEQYLSKSELEADELAEKQKELNLELAEKEMDLLKNYTFIRQKTQLESDVKQAEMALERTIRKAKADIVQAEASLNAKEAEYNRQKDKLKKIETQIEKTKIYAPADGLALYATSTERRGRFGPSDEPLDEGSTVRERQELITLPTTTGFNAEIDIFESSLDKVRPGLPVVITIEALPGERFMGKVVSIAPVPDAETSFMSPDIKVYPTLIEIENSDNINLLKSGMSCDAEIIVEQHKEAVYVPVQAVIRVNGKPTVYMGDGDDPEPRKVEIGLDNNLYIHIKKGLKEGEIVSLNPPLTQAVATDQGNTLIEGLTIDPAPAQSGNNTGANPPDARGNRADSRSSGFSGGAPVGFGSGGMPSKEDMIKRMDQDGDGKIAKSEMRFGAERFDEMDKNGDGFIVADEFEMPSFVGGGGNMRMPSVDEIFKMTDQDGDGKIAKSEMRFGAERFDEMDKNGDGFIEKDEFKMPSFNRGSSGGFNGPSGGMQGGGFPGGSR